MEHPKKMKRNLQLNLLWKDCESFPISPDNSGTYEGNVGGCIWNFKQNYNILTFMKALEQGLETWE